MVLERVIAEVCRELNNWFCQSRIFGAFEVKDGTLSIDGAQEGQYIRIIGSTFNDGVYAYPIADSAGLKDEVFEGAVWLMAVPPEVIQLVDDIQAWTECNSAVIDSPYTSESFGGYSYSKETGIDGGVTWQSHFRKRLDAWRKI